jgi:hypothetical protein
VKKPDLPRMPPIRTCTFREKGLRGIVDPVPFIAVIGQYRAWRCYGHTRVLCPSVRAGLLSKSRSTFGRQFSPLPPMGWMNVNASIALGVAPSGFRSANRDRNGMDAVTINNRDLDPTFEWCSQYKQPVCHTLTDGSFCRCPR